MFISTTTITHLKLVLVCESILARRIRMVKPLGKSMFVTNSMEGSRGHEVSVDKREPLKVRAKGCDKRLKGGKEKAVKKSRKCHGCGLLGQSHDKRNCPKLMNMSSQDASYYWLLMIAGSVLCYRHDQVVSDSCTTNLSGYGNGAIF
ncbi:hypothetical protein RHSIM_Rhsim09G0092300 [Rhododendron simsii]|uniref:Uncharacterized protein n=1 Tax=Rhododendron simsii TaxID=118357 RepID=A0A834GH81_RHOSS|nr:hypothetical protein RHSIM_Rhsim09G0092300 [Rhododendron simsii]